MDHTFAEVIMGGIKVGGKDISIFGIESSGHTLISRAVALEFAELVLRDNFGAEILAAQSPLTIERAADEWIIRGGAPDAVGPNQSTDPKEPGRFEMRIAQLDGQIRRLMAFRSSERNLVSSKVALEFARLVLRDKYGVEALAKQSPLTIEAAGDEWLVRGSAPTAVGRDYPKDSDEHGRFEMDVSRLDARILRLTFTISFPEAAEYAARAKSGVR